MKHKVYTVFDCKVEAYLSPFVLPSRGEAIRAFTEVSNDVNSKICKYAEDFTLFEIGDFDQTNGKIEMNLTPISLGKAVEFKRLNHNGMVHLENLNTMEERQ